MTEVEEFFINNIRKQCVNEMPVTETPWRYRHPDHYEMATEAQKEGKKYYYYEPVNPDNPNGKLRRCEPKYVYRLDMVLTEDQYNEIMEKVMSSIPELEILKPIRKIDNNCYVINCPKCNKVIFARKEFVKCVNCNTKYQVEYGEEKDE